MIQDRSSLTSLRELAESLFMGVNLGRLPKLQPGTASKVPMIHVKDVTDDVLRDIDRLDQIHLPSTPQHTRQRLGPADILLSARGTLMKCVVVPRSHWGAVASANFIVIRLGQSAPLQPELLCA